MGTETLSDIFKEDHTTIKNLLDEFKRFQAIKTQDLALFKKIRWTFEKHIFFEEKSAFSWCEFTQNSDEKFLNRLINDHVKLLNIFKRMENEIEQSILVNVNEIIGEIDFHVDFEEEFFYEKLDVMLTPKQKAIIKDGLAQSAKAGFYPINKIREFGWDNLKKYCDNSSK